MSHPTYRHLDTPVRLFGLDWRQWLLVVACCAVAVLMVDVLRPPTEIALFFGTLLIGAPVVFAYITAEADTNAGAPLRDFARWLLRARELPTPANLDAVDARGVLLANTHTTPSELDAGSATAPSELEARWCA